MLVAVSTRRILPDIDIKTSVIDHSLRQINDTGNECNKALNQQIALMNELFS